MVTILVVFIIKTKIIYLNENLGSLGLFFYFRSRVQNVFEIDSNGPRLSFVSQVFE